MIAATILVVLIAVIAYSAYTQHVAMQRNVQPNDRPLEHAIVPAVSSLLF